MLLIKIFRVQIFLFYLEIKNIMNNEYLTTKCDWDVLADF